MDIDCLLLVHRMDGLRPAEKALVADTFDDPAILVRLDRSDIEDLIGRRLGAGGWQLEAWRRQAAADRRWLEAGQGGCLWRGGAGYPAWLAEIDEPPFGLFWRGHPPRNDLALLAAVGTRRPSEYGRLAAWELGRDCARAGVGLVSGLAFGIDAAAHAGAVQLDGYSLAVLAGGIDLVQPRTNARLAARLIDAGGTLLAEFGPGTVAKKWHFPVRNRIISGLCPALVVVEAPEKSGALITARYALDQGRDVYVHTAGCQGPRGTGTKNLAEAGAVAIRGLDDLVRAGG
jgi:DNA processing protein